jgi:tRNA (Thr-GGU) A37 N-methylase
MALADSVGAFTVLWQEKGGLRRNRGVGVDVLDGTPVLDLKLQKEVED